MTFGSCSKAHVPQNWEYLSSDENVMSQVMEMEYMPKPLSDHLGVGKDLFPASTQLEDDEIKIYMRSNTDIQLEEGEKLFSEFKNRNVEYALPMHKLIAR